MATTYRGRHRAWRGPGRRVRSAAVLAACAAVTGVTVSGPLGSAPSATPALAPVQQLQHAQLASSTETVGQRLLDVAETRAGDWYVYGGAGPSVFDCSGLVYWAAGQIGLKNWPRSTYDLLGAGVASGRLVRTYSPQRGDLAFYGSGHVEINTVWYHMTFGSQQPGTRVGWHRWSSYWAPTAFYRIRW